MDTLKSFLSPLGMNTNAIQDTLKLVVLGGTVETARRVSVSAWNGFVDSFFLTAHFSQEDYPYDWLMHWLAKQPAWGRSREFEITTRSGGRNSIMQTTAGDLEEEEEEEDGLVHGRRRRKVQFMPSVDTTHTIYYRGHWLRITRTKRYPDYGHGASLKISVVARNNDILKKLVLEAKREYEKDSEHRVHIFLADTSYWRFNGSRQKRPMSSIVLEPGVKEMLLADCKDFLNSEEWYAERGIPFRRGYLLHGVPGSGKTSLIHSLAGELGLDIYVVSLSAKGMSDNTLSTLMSNVPTRCILLLEDLDAAFTRGISRDEKSTGAPTVKDKDETKKEENDGSTLSLSGLLNSLDGVAAAEGRLLFATTNHIERLDPALSRPGRMDVWVNFANATKWQAEGIFKCFFPCRPAAASAGSSTTDLSASSSSTDAGNDASQKNIPGSKRKASKHAIPLLSEDEIADLAKKFGEAIPDNELSVASLQGYLLKNKSRPREAVEEVEEWIKTERETREKIKREKAEREAKEAQEKADAEEKVKKEKEDKEAKEKKEKEDKEAKEKAERKASKKKASPRSETTPASSVAPTESSATEEASSASSSSAEETSGADADVEESVTSEEESDIGALVDAATSTTPAAEAAKKDKWVAVKGASASSANAATATPTTPEPEVASDGAS